MREEIISMKTYGYARVSTQTQSIKRQIENIEKVAPDAVIFSEAYTGRKVVGRKELAKLLRVVKPGDQIIFDSVSRMSRDADEGYNLYMQLFDKGVELHFIKEPQIDTTVYRSALAQRLSAEGIAEGKDQATSQLVSSIFNALNEYFRELARQQIRYSFEVAQKEVDDLRQRTREGMAARKAADPDLEYGRRPGTYGSYNVKKYEQLKPQIIKLSRDFKGKNTDLEVIKLTGLARGTYYSYKRRITEELQQEESAALSPV